MPFRSKALLAVILLVVLSSAAVLGESLTISGVNFQVDQLEPADQGSFRVRIGKQEALVSEQDLERFIVKAYFSSEELAIRFDPAKLDDFILNSQENKDIDLAELAARWAKRLLGPREFSELAQRIGDGAGSQDIVKAMLRGLNESYPLSQEWLSAAAELMLKTAAHDAGWLRLNCAKLFYAYSEELKNLLEERITQALAQLDTEAASELLAVRESLFNSDSERLQKLRLILSRAETINSSDESQGVENLYPLFEICKQDSLHGQVLYPLLATKVHAAAEHAIQRGEAALALTMLSRTELNRRTPKTHELILASLHSLKPKYRLAVISDSTTSQFLRGLALNDEAIKAVYKMLIFDLAESELSAGKPWALDLLLSRLLAVQPDPYHENDQLRMKQARAYLSMNMRGAALRKLDDVRTEISIFDHMRLALSGIFIRPGIVFVLLFLPLSLLGCAFLYLFRKEPPQKEPPRSKTPEQPKSSQSSGSEPISRSSLSPRMSDYFRNLAVLGLGAKATEKDIKAAYRNAVKKLHPDATGEVSNPIASEQFITLTEAYERSLQLRIELKIVDE
ncbi:MAG: hypothetical protein DCC75_06470 [Proteobacteria bacterium]|nr:MAG: hypothetical protein DCC75_06470 [Pseudomonadota bacterium]